MTLAKSEAKLLHDKITEKCYNDDDFIRVLTTRSKAQINATLNHYKDEFGQEINKVWQSRGEHKNQTTKSKPKNTEPI